MTRVFTFGGQSCDAYGLKCLTVDRSFLPPLTARTVAVPKRPGVWYLRSDLGPRTVNIGVSLIKTDLVTLTQAKQVIGGWLYPNNQIQPLVLPDEPDKTYYAVVDINSPLILAAAGGSTTNQPLLYGAGSSILTFLCPDPYGYGQQVTAQFAGDVLSPNVGGTAETYPTISLALTAATSSLKVAHSSGLFVLLNYSFSAGDTVTIDCVRQVVTINGATALTALDISSDFFALQPNNNTITITPSATATGSVAWTERYL
ncbi:distal tail protein Dit [Alicyclobacillus sp. ALC3]|uniref:distal tail protein Dit n=1 Tax=Alicyclobacillus sp. ALC3 TaxID=2796143 RepID=UPI0023785694|nr:distal tail protein Dit [Alicyclobacillus sp. ALC3]WDL98121.1 phage tail family protein [Alicyclobacillus sp. ALC3]